MRRDPLDRLTPAAGHITATVHLADASREVRQTLEGARNCDRTLEMLVGRSPSGGRFAREEVIQLAVGVIFQRCEDAGDLRVYLWREDRYFCVPPGIIRSPLPNEPDAPLTETARFAATHTWSRGEFAAIELPAEWQGLEVPRLPLLTTEDGRQAVVKAVKFAVGKADRLPVSGARTSPTPTPASMSRAEYAARVMLSMRASGDLETDRGLAAKIVDLKFPGQSSAKRRTPTDAERKWVSRHRTEIEDIAATITIANSESP